MTAKRERDQAARAPAGDYRLTQLIGIAAAPAHRIGEAPGQCHIGRQDGEIAGQHRAQHLGLHPILLGHLHHQLRARPAILVQRRDDLGRVPGIARQVAAIGTDARRQAEGDEGARIGVDNIFAVADIIVPQRRAKRSSEVRSNL